MSTDFIKLQQEIFEAAEEEKMEDAMDFVEQAEVVYPEQMHKTSFWKACLFCGVDQADRAVPVLQKAIRNRARWNPETLLNEPDLKPVHDSEAFQEIILYCKNRLKEVQSQNTKSELLVWTSKDSANTPLIISAHMRGDSIANFSGFWNDKKLSERYTLAFPQSLQVRGPNEFCWDDQIQAKDDLIQAYHKVKRDYDVNRDQVIFAGASQGANLAIKMALEENEVSAKGFVAIVPALKDIKPYPSTIKEAAERGIRGCIIAGDQDPFYDGARAFHLECKEHGLPCKLLVSEGLGHFFPNDFPDRLIETVDFIFEGSS